jgi:hypothetical protein
LKRLNDFQGINKYFRLVNKKLPVGGVFITIAETYAVRKQRLLKKFPFPFNRIYYGIDVFITRITPKISLTKRLYYFLSTGKGRVLSRTEVLGRLYYCGFEVIDEKIIDNKLYFAAKKIKDPIFSIHKPSYGFIIKLPRVGKDGKIIGVYKFRTMHPYSEYLQQYEYIDDETWITPLFDKGNQWKSSYHTNRYELNYGHSKKGEWLYNGKKTGVNDISKAINKLDLKNKDMNYNKFKWVPEKTFDEYIKDRTKEAMEIMQKAVNTYKSNNLQDADVETEVSFNCKNYYLVAMDYDDEIRNEFL